MAPDAARGSDARVRQRRRRRRGGDVGIAGAYPPARAARRCWLAASSGGGWRLPTMQCDPGVEANQTFVWWQSGESTSVTTWAHFVMWYMGARMSCFPGMHLSPDECCADPWGDSTHHCWRGPFTLEKCCGHNMAPRLWTSGGDPTCWSGGFTRRQCCGPTSGGECWDTDGVFTYRRCCDSASPPPAVLPRNDTFRELAAAVRAGLCLSPTAGLGPCEGLWRAGLRRARQLKDVSAAAAARLLLDSWRAIGVLGEAAAAAPAFVASLALHVVLALVDDSLLVDAPPDAWARAVELTALFPAGVAAASRGDMSRLRLCALDDALRHRARAHYHLGLEQTLVDRMRATDQLAPDFFPKVDGAFRSALEELVDVLQELGVGSVPIQGTLIALLRYGTFPAGRLGKGKWDVVDNDGELMVILEGAQTLAGVLGRISAALEARGWPPCLNPHDRKGVCLSLRHAVPCKLELYFVRRDDTAGVMYAERKCWTTGRPCEYSPVFPFQVWGGRLPLGIIFPLRPCRLGLGGLRQALCPHRPVEFLRGWNQGEYLESPAPLVASAVAAQPPVMEGEAGGESGCPPNGIVLRSRCWILSGPSEPCNSACPRHGLRFWWAPSDKAEPVMPLLLGRQPVVKKRPWMGLECYVATEDHLILATRLAGSDDETSAWGDWWFPGCRLACPCVASSPQAVGADSAAATRHGEVAECRGDAGGTCLALPVLSSDRDRSDPRNQRLQREGLDADDLQLLLGYARALDAKGFASFLPHLRSDAACIRRAKRIAAGDPLAGLSRMGAKAR